jgi:hypothetical protein
MKKRRRLQLNKDTLRTLSQEESRRVVGGDTFQDTGCNTCNQATCFGCGTWDNTCQGCGSYGNCPTDVSCSWCYFSRYETWCAGCDTATCQQSC